MYRRHKFNAVRSKCSSGHYHPSKLEASYCDNLRMLTENGDIADYETQYKAELYVNDKKITTHYIDFMVTTNDGKKEAHETKGMESQLWKIKKRLFEALNPDIEYIVIK